MENNRKTGNVARGEKVFGVTLTAAVIAVILILNVFLFVLNSTLGIFYLVPTSSSETSLSDALDAKFLDAENKGAKVKITFCMAEDELEASTVGSRVFKTAKQFVEKYPSLIEIDHVNVIVEKPKLEKYIDAGHAIRKNTVIIESGENFKVLTDTASSVGFIDFFTTDSDGNEESYEGETVFAGMISWVLSPTHPKAYLTVGHSEQIDPAFSLILTASGYTVERLIDLSSEAVPDDCDLLIISTPKNDFETSVEGSAIPYVLTETGRLEAYLKRGGNLYVSLDPYIGKLTSLEGVLASCGMKLSEAVDEGKSVRHIIKDNNGGISDAYTIATKHSDNAVAKAIGDTVSRYNDGSVIVRLAGAILLDKGAMPLVEASESAELMRGTESVEAEGGYAVAAYNKLTLEGGTKEATVFVTSSIYLTVTSAVITNGYSNRDFTYAVFEHLYGREGLPYGCTSNVYDNQTLENLTLGETRLYTVLALVPPALIAVAGAVVVIRRKNR